MYTEVIYMNHRNLFFYLILFLSLNVLAAPTTLNFQANIKKPDGSRLESPSVSFRLHYLNSAGNCTVYIEDFNNLSMVGSGGNISLNLGNGAKFFPPSVTTLNDTFNNSTSNIMACAEGGNYTPTLATEKRNMRVEFVYAGSGGTQAINGIEVNSVPYAMYASDANKLNGFAGNLFLKFSDVTTCTGGDLLQFNGTVFSCVAAGSVTNFTGNLVGDVSGTQTATVVDAVGGKTSTQISNSVDDTLNATNLSTASRLVKRDGSGNAAFNTAQATNFSGRNLLLFEATDTNKVTVVAPATFAAGDYTLTLPDSNGAPGEVLSTDGNGVLSWISSGSGSVTSVGATLPLSSTGGATPNISMPASTTAVDGYLTAADFTTFNNKVSTGLGTVNQVPKYTAAGAIGDSNISDNGTVVTVSTNAVVNGISIGRGVGSSSESTAAGIDSLSVNTTGQRNTAMGYQALAANTTGNYNTAHGASALTANTTGTENTATGDGSLASNTVGTHNTATGDDALSQNTTGGYNTAVGQAALYNNTTGTSNAVFGHHSGDQITTGSNNVVIGSNSGATIATSNNNIIISDGSGNIRQQIDSAGRVGIGMAPATYMLNVNGDINIPAGSNFKINGVNLAAAGGTVTDVSSANGDITVTNQTTTPQLTLNSGVAGGVGDANKIAKLSATGQLTAAMLPAVAVTTSTVLAGDVTGTTGVNSVDRIKGVDVMFTGIASGNFLKYNGAAWVNAIPGITDIKSNVSGNFFTAAGACAAGTTLTYTAVNDNLSCLAYTITSSQVTNALTYTPVNKAGDTMTGSLDIASTVSANSTTEGTVIAYVNSGAGYTIPDTTLNVRQILLTADTTITLPTFAAPAGKVFNLTVFVKQDGTGSRTITWAGSGGDTIKWDTGLPSVFSANPNKITILQFVKPAHETVWYASEIWRED